MADLDEAISDWHRSAAELNALARQAKRFSDALLRLGRDPEQLARAALARSGFAGLSDGPVEKIDPLAYHREWVAMAFAIMGVAEDLNAAAAALNKRTQPTRGNQSKLAQRFMITAAAEAYSKLFNRMPGRSRSDLGPFGKFIDQIIEQVPEAQRPAKLSAAAIHDALMEWFKRRTPTVAD